MVRQAGFTYIAVILAVALAAAVLAATGVVWHVVQKRAREEDLLYVGDQFRKAIASYARAPAGGVVGALPQQLQDLLQDPRHPGIKRHLRKIYADPMTGTTEWGIVRTEAGGIQGVYSLSEDRPLKTGNFRPADKEFAGRSKYSEWKFVFGEEQARKAGLPGRGTAPVPGAGVPGQPPQGPGELPFGQVPLGQQLPDVLPPGAPLTAPGDTGQPQLAPQPAPPPPPAEPEEQEPQAAEPPPPQEEAAPVEPPPSREAAAPPPAPAAPEAPPSGTTEPADAGAPPPPAQSSEPAPLPGASPADLLQPVAPGR